MSIKRTAYKSSFATTVKSKLSDYAQLVKLRLNALVVFSAVMSMLFVGEDVSAAHILVLAIGGFLVTGAANALNQVLEKDFDAQMSRTANRPLAAGRMKSSEAVLSAGLMSVVGIASLSVFSPLAGLLGAISMLLYSFVYTPLKRVSPIAVVVGAIPGALPLMIGGVAIEGTIGLAALYLFTIQFFWQFPHFWAIAWLGHDDYSKAGFKLLPTKTGGRDEQAGLQSIYYAWVLIPLSWLPFYMGWSGIASAIILTILGGAYTYLSYRFYKDCTRAAARKLMFSSFVYLPLTLIVLLVDKI